MTETNGLGLRKLLLILATCLLGTSYAAANPLGVKISTVQVGLPVGGRATEPNEYGNQQHYSKFATRAPIYVQLQLLKSIQEPLQLVIETPDADAIGTSLSVPLDITGQPVGVELNAWAIGPIPYLRPANGMGETTIQVRTVNGIAVSEPYRIRHLRTREADSYCVLALGSDLRSLTFRNLRLVTIRNRVIEDDFAMAKSC